jgi:hypothetical protein
MVAVADFDDAYVRRLAIARSTAIEVTLTIAPGPSRCCARPARPARRRPR